MIKITTASAIPNSIHQEAIPYLKSGLKDQLQTISDQQLKLAKADSKPGSVARIVLEDRSLLIIGCGDTYNPMNFAANALRGMAPGAPLVLKAADEAEAKQLAMGAILGQKTPSAYKSEQPVDFEVVIVHQDQVALEPELTTAQTIVRIRELINQPANDLYPELLAEKAKELAEAVGITVEIWDQEKLEQERCGGILSVGKGSARPPRLVKLSYSGGGKHLALVGKGITFDTGGLSLKPAESMVGMKYDMAGSATVLGAMIGIALKKTNINITGFMCLAENMPSGEATRPGDVIRIRNGKTVEVLNTDAEGRLVLADGLSLAAELSPDHIVDVATLTGAATIALGNRYTGLMGTGAAVKLALESAQRSGELLWEMPLPVELREILNSELADIANVKIGNRAGGMLVGGQFLKDFVPEGTSWAHLDIAPSANNDAAPYDITPQGATGVMIRTLIDMADSLASS